MNDNFKFSLGDLFDKAIHTIGKYSDYYVSDYVYTSGLEDLNDEGVRILEYRDAKDWNIDFRSIPGFKEVSNFFKSGYKHFANDHEYIHDMFELPSETFGIQGRDEGYQRYRGDECHT